MAVTWDQLTFLTPQQQNAAKKFADIGLAAMAASNGGPMPDLSGVSQGQAKTADKLMRELMDLISPAQTGIKYVNQFNENKALADYQAAHPPA